MDVFNYFEDRNAQIAQHLNEASLNYWQLPHEHTFNEVRKEFESIEDHFYKEVVLLNKVKHKGRMKNLLAAIVKKRIDISSAIEETVNTHEDGLEFEHALKSLSNMFLQYADYCANTFYPALQKQMTREDLNSVSDQLWQKVAS